MAITWNPSDKGALITLSNGDLTAAASVYSTFDSVRATESVSSGKIYWEIYIDDIRATNTVGVGNSSAGLSVILGSDANGWGYQNNGQKITANGSTAYGSTFTGGDIIGVALDLDNGKIWFAKNNAWQASGDPTAGTNEAFSGISGSIFPMGGCGRYQSGTGCDTQTIRPDTTSQSYSPPSGFSSLEGDPMATDLFDGKVSINTSADLFDGEARIQDDGTDLFDGEARIQDDGTNLFDGKLKLTDLSSDLFDGKLRVQDDTVDLFDGEARIKDVATDLFDGRLVATYTGHIDGYCPTPTGQFVVGKIISDSCPTPTCEIAAVFRYARIDADVPVPTAGFKVGRIITGDSPVPGFTCTANIGRYPSLLATAPCPTGSMRVGLSLSDIATISRKAGVPVPTGQFVATSAHLATILGNMPCPLITCTADTENVAILSAPVPCPRGLFDVTVGNVADILGRAPCPSCGIVAITGNVITLAGSAPVPGSLVRFYASPMNVNITLDGTVPTPSMISRVHGLTSLILRHIRGEVR